MTTTFVPETTGAEPMTDSRSTRLRRSLIGLGADVGLPVGAYYALHALGFSDTIALLAGTVAAAVRVAAVALRSREITWFPVVLLGVYGVGLALTFVDGDPHFLLLKDSLGSAVIGLVFLVSLVVGRPFVLAAMESLRTPQTDEIVRRYVSTPLVRRRVRAMTALWGAGLIGEALVRIPIVYAVPIDVGVAVSHALTLVAVAVLGAINAGVVWHTRRVLGAGTGTAAETR